MVTRSGKDWPQDKSEPDDEVVSTESRKIVCTVKTHNNPVDPKKYSSWRKLIKITAYVLKFVSKIRSKTQKIEETLEQSNNSDCLSPQELKGAEIYSIKDA
jgi:heme-binding NEAT domain protein